MPQVNMSSVKDDATKRVALAEVVRQGLGRAKVSRQEMLNAYMDAGAALLEAKNSLRHGRWEDWLKEQVNLSPVQARRYMRLAETVVTTDLKGDVDEATLERIEEKWRAINGNKGGSGPAAASEKKQAHSPTTDTIEQHPRAMRSSPQRSEPAPRVTNRAVSDAPTRLFKPSLKDEVTTEEVEYQEEQSEDQTPSLDRQVAHHRETDVADEQAPSQDGPEVIELSLWEEERDEVYLLAGDLQAVWKLPTLANVLIQSPRFAHCFLGPAVGNAAQELDGDCSPECQLLAKPLAGCPEELGPGTIEKSL